MAEVEIPFRSQFENAMISDRKTATSRTKLNGKIGDTFKAFGHLFEITELHRLTLSDVAQRFYRQEGVESPGDFMQVWQKLHRGVWNPQRLIWLHRFRRIRKL
jgi:hypothetical protein